MRYLSIALTLGELPSLSMFSMHVHMSGQLQSHQWSNNTR